ncbi:urea amidolyase associated protein UAAP2 [Aquirhabdus sp.]|uniref:urea amidolyase associated protein UAAP2 n=1 Tax=Aquirhabdus sp. TaxID=2824160 RepID=UPI00396C6EE6
MEIKSITSPASFKLSAPLKESPLTEATAINSEICAAGEPWMGRVVKGQTFRIVDLEGNQAVDTLFFNANNLEERYSPAHTVQKSGQLYLGLGSKLYSSNAQVMATISADTCGRHDTLGGACASESNTVRYAMEKRPMHSCRDNFMTALTTFPLAEEIGLDVRDIGANINFFMNVPVLPDGELYFADGISGAGKYVEIIAEMDLIVLISNCPQLNNPCNGYNPTPIKLLTWEATNHA